VTFPIAADLRLSVVDLFTVRRDRRVVLGLVALAAAVSTTELAATKLFSELILPGAARTSGKTAILVVLFFAVFGGLRLVNYAREMYRLRVFERALTESGTTNAAGDSWRWAKANEVTSLLSAVSRVVVITVAVVVLAPAFGIAVVIAVALVGKALSMIFTRQLDTQREFRAMQKARTPASNATRVRTRIRAGEIGSLIAYFAVVVLLGALVVLTLQGVVEPGTAFVMFVALRMMGQMLTDISKGLVRYGRARANSE